MYREFLRKSFAIVASFAFLLQSFTPFVALTPQVVYAQEVSPTDTPTPSSTVTPTTTPTDTITPTPTDTVTPTDNVTPTPDATVSPTPSNTPIVTETPTPTVTDTLTPTTDQPSPTTTPGNANNPSQAPPPTTPTTTPSVTPGNQSTDTNGELNATILKNVSAPTLDLSSSNDQSATLTTDKSDYSPTDTALISGSNFKPNTTYSLTISSTDAPATSTTVNVTTDNNGSFTYAYQLDGNYRPDYSVVVKDGNTTVATTTFTDSPASGCESDAQGANDQPGQKDLTKMCANYSGLPTSESVTWNWDDTSFSGANTGDACSLFDTNNDGLADYALCVGVNGTPTATWSYTKLYSCGNGSAEKCTQSVTQINSPASSCTASVVSGANPFDSGSDTVANCTVKMSDVGGSTANLLDVCSFPSGQPNSDPSDCIVASTASQTGTLQVTKVLSPTTDTGLFNLQIDSTTYATNISSGGTTGPKVVTAGNHTVAETAGTNTSLSDYTPSIVCKDNGGTGTTVASSSTSGPLTVNVAKNANVLCTITNTRNQGTLKIVKNTVGGDGTFNFSVTGTSTTSANIATSGGTGNTSLTLTPGTYSVTETAVNGWTTTYSNCSNVTVTANQTTTCTVTNTKQATLTVNKVVSPSNDTGLFNLQIDGTTAGTGANVGNGGATGAVVVSAGSHMVSETAGTSTNLSNYTAVYSGDCDANGNVTVSAGQNAVCTITNTRNTADLKVQKVVDDGSALSDWAFSLDGAKAISADSTTGIVDFGQVTTNVAHTITEGGANQSEYTLMSVAGTNCTSNNDGSSATVNIPNGIVSTTCIFTNDRDTGSVVVHKALDTTGNGTFTTDDTTASLLGFTWTLSGYSAKSFGTTINNVPTGSYTVTENVNSQPYTFVGWYTTGSNTYSCTNPQGTILPISVGVAYVSTTDITLCNQRETGTITLNKVWSGTAGQTTLNIGTKVGGTDVASVQTGANGTAPLTTGTKTVTTGTYYLSETNGLTNYSSSLSCYDNNGAVAIGANNSVTVGYGDNIVCTFTNTRNTGTLVITKTAYGSDGTDTFGFTVAGPTSSTQTITTSTGSNATFTGSTSNITVDTGTYSVTETSSPSGFTQTGVGCTDMTTNTPLSSNIGFTVSSGHTVACNFYDTKYSSISGLKFNDVNGNGNQHSGEAGIEGWKIDLTGTTFSSPGYSSQSVSQTATTDANGDFLFTNLLPGEYTVCEESQTGWNQTYPDIAHSNSSCSNGTNGYAVLIDSTQAGKDFNGNTFGNQGFGTVVINKITNGGDGTFDYTVSGQTSLSEEVTTASNQGSTGNITVAAGTYTVAEVDQPGWVQSGAFCTDGKTSFTATGFSVSAGQTVTCTFFNTELGSIAVVKNASGGDGTFTFSATGRGVPSSFDITTTNGTNAEVYNNLLPGDFSFSENSQPGWILSSASCTDNVTSQPVGTITNGVASFTLNAGQNVTCTYTNTKEGSVVVTKYLDDNANGTQDSGESVLSGWTINLASTSGAQSLVTDNNGQADFSNLVPGTYTVSEDLQSDWNQSAITCDNGTYDSNTQTYTFTVGAGSTVNCSVGNYKNATITVTKNLIDPDGNAVSSDTTAFTFGMTGQSNFDLSNRESQSFSIKPGTYDVTETANPDYTFVGCNAVYNNNSVGKAVSQGEEVTVDSSDTVAITCTNQQMKGHVTGYKWNDVSGNGQECTFNFSNFNPFNFDNWFSLWTCAPRLSGWTMFADLNQNGILDQGEPSTVTDSNGNYTLDLNPGTYRICEVSQKGWIQTYPANAALNDCQEVTVISNETTEGAVNFGNHLEIPILTLTKTNSQTGNKLNPGSSIVYTLTITATQSAAENVEIHDLLPKGFTYVAGSATINYGEGPQPFTNFSDDYHSPGIWNIGHMNQDQTITLTLTATIDGSQNPGDYKDLAWAKGTSLDGSTTVYANQDRGVFFVGTDAVVVKDTQSGVNVNLTQSVLGAATSILPDTGANTFWVTLGTLLVLIGTMTIAFGIILKKKYV